MRRTLAVLAAIVLKSCTEMATEPIEPPDEGPDVYVNEDAVRMFLRDLRTELTAVTDTVAFLKGKGGPRDPGMDR